MSNENNLTEQSKIHSANRLHEAKLESLRIASKLSISSSDLIENAELIFNWIYKNDKP